MSTVGAARAAGLPYRRQTPTLWQAFGRSVWLALERVGQRRAARELHALARRWQPFDPELAAALRDAARAGTAT